MRSRNCLKRMNIKTLGDLTRVTESQLLASKNFGETSLEEIRAVMNAKQLRIGQSLDQGQQYEFRYRPQQNLSPEEQATLNKPVSDLNLSVRARKCMNRLNISTLGELVQPHRRRAFGSEELRHDLVERSPRQPHPVQLETAWGLRGERVHHKDTKITQRAQRRRNLNSSFLCGLCARFVPLW